MEWSDLIQIYPKQNSFLKIDDYTTPATKSSSKRNTGQQKSYLDKTNIKTLVDLYVVYFKTSNISWMLVQWTLWVANKSISLLQVEYLLAPFLRFGNFFVSPLAWSYGLTSQLIVSRFTCAKTVVPVWAFRRIYWCTDIGSLLFCHQKTPLFEARIRKFGCLKTGGWSKFIGFLLNMNNLRVIWEYLS